MTLTLSEQERLDLYGCVMAQRMEIGKRHDPEDDTLIRRNREAMRRRLDALLDRLNPLPVEAP